MNYKIDFLLKTVIITDTVDLVTMSKILNELADYERTEEKSFKWKIKYESVPAIIA